MRNSNPTPETTNKPGTVAPRVDGEIFRQGMAYLALVVPGLMSKERDPDDAKAEVRAKLKTMYALVAHLPQDKFMTAVRIFLSRHKEVFPGTNWIAWILEYAEEGDYLDEAEAWDMARNGTKRVPWNKTWKDMIPNELVARAVEIIGPADIKWADEENIGVVRGHFLRLYNTLVERRKIDRIRALGEKPEK